ncbi:FecR family protein [Sphingobacterium sp. DR205]|uniref:FecR family protein n=1 Tax=Sphingobacterium sp. DR205 TaxID=2713573 RepID=UPI0013E412EC|nr:FecR family protein [Sphingobacterium sp. DR205]QIH35946.1 DUF4974 domain-containing protein [Sphingobacterium sp. DR205]
MRKQEIEAILWRFYNHLSNRQEKKSVESWYEYVEQLGEDTFNEDEINKVGERLRNSLFYYVDCNRPPKNKQILYLISSVFALAASLLIFLWFSLKDNKIPIVKAGSDKAMLIIGSEQPVDIGKLEVGKILQSGHVRIFKSKEGEIVYQTNASEEPRDNNINILKVPRGGQFKVNLPDGSTVCLNSDSELRYPSNFSQIDRQLELKGEAFFDVKHDSNKPFLVKTSRADIRVLGTKFNVMAYANESNWKTTVSEGKVRISNMRGKIILHKNEQAVIDSHGGISYSIVEDTNAFAWKDGSFHFQGTKIGDIARQVERWYDIEVEVDPRIKDQEFFGIILRQETANQLFEVLEATNTISVIITKEKIKIYPKTN